MQPQMMMQPQTIQGGFPGEPLGLCGQLLSGWEARARGEGVRHGGAAWGWSCSTVVLQLRLHG
jgi:hypothetical protein